MTPRCHVPDSCIQRGPSHFPSLCHSRQCTWHCRRLAHLECPPQHCSFRKTTGLARKREKGMHPRFLKKKERKEKRKGSRIKTEVTPRSAAVGRPRGWQVAACSQCRPMMHCTACLNPPVSRAQASVQRRPQQGRVARALGTFRCCDPILNCPHGPLCEATGPLGSLYVPELKFLFLSFKNVSYCGQIANIPRERD